MCVETAEAAAAGCDAMTAHDDDVDSIGGGLTKSKLLAYKNDIGDA